MRKRRFQSCPPDETTSGAEPCWGGGARHALRDSTKRGRNQVTVKGTMKFNDAARRLIEADPATLVTVNRDGSAQSNLVWLAVRSAADGNDELVTGHLSESQKVRNIRRDP